jgi:hypothetical protein
MLSEICVKVRDGIRWQKEVDVVPTKDDCQLVDEVLIPSRGSTPEASVAAPTVAAGVASSAFTETTTATTASSTQEGKQLKEMNDLAESDTSFVIEYRNTA